MDPWAIMNTQEIWAQPTPSPNPTTVANVTTATAMHRIDTCMMAGSNPKPSSSLPLLPSSPSLPLTDGPYVWCLPNPRRPKTTVSTTETGRSEGRGDGKRHIGVSDESRRPDREKLHVVVGKWGDWFINHLLDPGKSSPPTPIALPVGNCTGNPGVFQSNPYPWVMSLFSRVEGVVVVGCSRELPTTLENELLMLVFEDGSGGGGAKERPPSKTSILGLFSRMVWWWWCQGVTTSARHG